MLLKSSVVSLVGCRYLEDGGTGEGARGGEVREKEREGRRWSDERAREGEREMRDTRLESI
jgi:hypothetical protein